MTHTRVTAENDEGSFYEKQCSESYSECILHFSRKTRKLRRLCNCRTDLHKIWHDDAECVFQMQRPLKI